MVKIDADFDGGSVVVSGMTDDDEVALSLRRDSAADLRQWFCFRSWGEPGERRAFRVVNALDAEYPGGWEDYRVCASYDGEDWLRVPTIFRRGELRFRFTPRRRMVTFALFAPYSFARLQRLVGRARRSGHAEIEALGETVQGRPIPAITFGDASARTARVWIVARQHPGETMAAWCAEGIVDRLGDARDPLTSALLDEAVVTVVPAVNIDGGVLGNHRTNAAGRDLNRSWDAPDLEETPEVFAIRSAMLETGVDLFLDLHGDEAVPFVFAAGCEGNPGYTPRIRALEDGFKERLSRASPSFSTEPGYPEDAPGEGDLSAAANWVGQRFDCLSLTIEMPFKDATLEVSRRTGWSPLRSKAFGRSLLEAVVLTIDELR